MLAKVENTNKQIDIKTEFDIHYIRLNLEIMQDEILKASKMIEEGLEATNEFNQNGAIGSISGLDTILDKVKSLHDASLIIHKHR